MYIILFIINLDKRKLNIMKSNYLTYKKSGVDIKAADKFVKYIAYKVKETKKSVNFKNIGGFGSISKIPNKKNLNIVTSTDGVGTKLEIANDLKQFNSIGIDLVAMSVNDLIVQGAKPYFFLDYISIDRLNLIKLKSIINGIVKGCEIAGCKLVGGETAEMPGTYSKDKFDLAGFAIGFVEKKKIIYKNKIKKGNLILAIPSSGLHSNGYSLVRKILKTKKINLKKNRFLKDELIRPTKIYVKEILKLNDKNFLNGCANITGGGIKDNIKRIMPNGLCAEIDLKNIKPNKIFKWIKMSGVTNKEMYKTFNCGLGFCIIINPKNINNIKKYFHKRFKPYLIGRIVNGKKKVKLKNNISW